MGTPTTEKVTLVRLLLKMTKTNMEKQEQYGWIIM